MFSTACECVQVPVLIDFKPEYSKTTGKFLGFRNFTFYLVFLLGVDLGLMQVELGHDSEGSPLSLHAAAAKAYGQYWLCPWLTTQARFGFPGFKRHYAITAMTRFQPFEGEFPLPPGIWVDFDRLPNLAVSERVRQIANALHEAWESKVCC